MNQPDFLNIPKSESVTFERNFISSAVCELRFPTLLGFDEGSLLNIHKKLKREYPIFEKGQSIGVGGPDGLNKETHYYFYSKNRKWWVKFRSSAVTLETEDYKNFEDFSNRLNFVISASKDSLDTDFFTRVGLRYINQISVLDDEINGWVREDLISSLLCGALGTPKYTRTEVQGYISDGFYGFRHGLQSRESTPDSHDIYYLDFDYFAENIEIENALSLAAKFNSVNFSFFHWCLGDKGIAALGKSTPKNK